MSRLVCLWPLTLLFIATPALGQRDTLEQPYEADPNAPPPEAVQTSEQRAPNNEAPAPMATLPHAAAVSGVVPEAPRADDRPLGPIRARRRLALTGELGWNGLSGFGPVLSYHVMPELTVELGAGASFTGWKGGVRARYNFVKGAVTPFLGAGMMATGGLGVVTGDFNDHASNPDAEGTDEVTIRVRPSQFVQVVGGLDWTASGGFTLIGTVGWASLLNDNFEIVAGTPSREARQAFHAVFGSGPVIVLALGYSFR
ncbi:MAG TPA: hypothetical protein VFQ61_01965 [Polyangiaceae bacterium]|nr:hypothetical protein [Polyangiaceae bacterium]